MSNIRKLAETYRREAMRQAEEAHSGWSCTLMSYIEEVEEENRRYVKTLRGIVAAGRCNVAELKTIASIALIERGKSPVPEGGHMIYTKADELRIQAEIDGIDARIERAWEGIKADLARKEWLRQQLIYKPTYMMEESHG
jgi:hypothetical protein